MRVISGTQYLRIFSLIYEPRLSHRTEQVLTGVTGIHDLFEFDAVSSE